jgi:general secretion pathway protein G
MTNRVSSTLERETINVEMKRKTRFRQQGMTLIEILVVLAILGLLAGLVGPNLLNRLDSAKTKTAAVQIQDLEQGLEMYKLDVGRFPTTDEGLEALQTQPANAPGWNGPYLKGSVPVDPWGQPYHYKSPGEHSAVDIISYGADGKPGGEGDSADVHNWK